MNNTGTFKKWGGREFWGLDSSHDQDWILTDEQITLRDKLIELCRMKIRPHAIHCDRTYEYPRKSLNALSELGLLGLIVPKEFGGLGENHVASTMIVETIARYGCPSTALIYTMHLGAVSSLLLRYHNNKLVQDLLIRINKEKLIGTLSYSDPATGGHFWFPLSSKTKMLDQNMMQILKYGSWATSAGYADWYTVQTISPDFKGDFSNLSCFLIFKDEVRAAADNWSALGMHGNQSGPLVIDGKIPLERRIGPFGDGRLSNDECIDPYFLLLTSAAWNGISLACMDLAKRHVTRKAHADMGFRVCDYPTIQDYFGDSLCEASTSRSHLLFIAQAMDKATNNNNSALHEDLAFLPRSMFLHWLWICKYVAAKNVNTVADTMLHICGGSGYKTDLGFERLLRDAKAGWVMGPSNEVLRQFVGKSCLLGFSSVDYWEQNHNERLLNHELGKLNIDRKKELMAKLLEEVTLAEKNEKPTYPFQDTDFENPFNTSPPRVLSQSFTTKDEKTHCPAFIPSKWTALRLASRKDISRNMCSFLFALPKETDHTGCLPGQYIQIRANTGGKIHKRYFSPVSNPFDFGKLELVLKFETQGIISNFFQTIKPGEMVEGSGPCGGFEYEPNHLEELTLLASGGGITPGMQLIRCICNNPSDKTRVTLIYYSENYDEILFRHELDKYIAQNSRLRLIYALGEAPQDWNGHEGFIDTALIDCSVTKAKGIKHKIVICGGPMMTISCLHSLKCLKYPSEIIFIYGQLGAELLRAVYGRNVKLSGHRSDNAL